MRNTTAEQSPDVIYRIDADDLIRGFNSPWADFARANDAAELAEPDHVIGRPLWDFITGTTERTLYHHMLRRVRQFGRPITLPYRCDGPTARRFMQLTITRATNDQLEFRSKYLLTEPRARQPLLSRYATRSSRMLEACSFCNRIQLNDHWDEAEQIANKLKLFNEPVLPQLTHGVCPDCLPEFQRRLTINEPARSEPTR